MKIYPIQPSTSKSKQNSFKAKFVYDNNGYFRQLWQNESKMPDLSYRASLFAKYAKNSILEITRLTRDKSGKIAEFDVFNQKNGAFKTIKCNSAAQNTILKDFTADVVSGKHEDIVHANYSISLMYQTLLGL